MPYGNLAETTDETVTTIENVIRALVQGFGSHAFFLGLHDAFVDGELHQDAGENISERDLVGMFRHLDSLVDIAEEIG